MGAIEYRWPSIDAFVNRSDELARMERWWRSGAREPLAVLGRRRVGKSWLFRRFAHGKPAVVLVAERLPTSTQLVRFASVLEPVVGVRPALDDLGSLFRVLFRAAADRKLLVVIDEFPYVLGASDSEVSAALSSVQAVMEDERDRSKLKLVLCGSHVGQMEAMFGERNPMHGRLERLDVRPLGYTQASGILAGIDDPFERFERYCVAGGMPMYLSRLDHGALREAVCAAVLDRDAPLWNEGRAIVEQELREPRVYFAILERLAHGPQALNDIAQHAGLDTSRVSKYLTTLTGLKLVSRVEPMGARRSSRSGHWQLDDSFLRFWFRFVFPFQGDLEGGLDAGDLFDHDVEPELASHCSPVFESWTLAWLRAKRTSVATSWGRWWGNAANRYRHTGQRSTEEIDAIGMRAGRVVAVSESKWTNKLLTARVVEELDTYKIPALRDAGLRVVTDPRVILFCRSGYTDGLRELAQTDQRIELIDVRTELAIRQ